MSAPNLNPGRKPRQECILKNLPPARQAALFSFMEGSGDDKPHSYKQCAEWLAADGIRADAERLRQWRDWYYLRLGFQSARDDARTLLESEAEEGEPVPEEKIQRVGNRLFSMRAIKERDVKTWGVVRVIEQNEVRLAQNKTKLDLISAKLHREDVTRFLAWLENKRVMEIANKPGSNADKIELLGQEMFGEDWK